MDAQQLKTIPLFSNLDMAALEELATVLKEKNCPAHHTIFWMNEKGRHLYIVEKGKVEISYTDEEGNEMSLAHQEQGSFFGELSLIDGEPHSATARTLVPTTLLSLDSDSFHRFLSRHPELGFTLLQVLSSRLRTSTVKMRKVVNINKELEAERSPLQHSIDKISKVLTSGHFLSLYSLFIAGWIISQALIYKKQNTPSVSFIDRPPDFPILSFFVTLMSFLLTILILYSQRRQADNDRIRGEIEYQVNVKSQSEVMKLQLKMDQLLEKLNEGENGLKENS